jgi:carbonic anhydrase
MRYCTVINCMDGRVQLPVIRYCQTRFDTPYVDSITEPGPNCVFAKQEPAVLVDSLLKKLAISVEKHKSVGIAIAGHHDCAGNLSPKVEQNQHTQKAVAFLQKHFPDMQVIGLWINDKWQVEEL